MGGDPSIRFLMKNSFPQAPRVLALDILPKAMPALSECCQAYFPPFFLTHCLTFAFLFPVCFLGFRSSLIGFPPLFAFARQRIPAEPNCYAGIAGLFWLISCSILPNLSSGSLRVRAIVLRRKFLLTPQVPQDPYSLKSLVTRFFHFCCFFFVFFVRTKGESLAVPVIPLRFFPPFKRGRLL